MTDNLLDNEIPEKFRDPETGEPRLDTLVRSYKELERKMSAQPRPPKTPEDYCIDCSHGLFESDPDINQRLHARGFTEEQAQEVYDLAAEKMIPMIMEIAGDFQADREVEKLINHFGGPDKWKSVSRQLLAFGQNHLPADVLDNLASSFEGVLALHRMMVSDEPGLSRSGSTRPDCSSEKDLHAMMRDPKYWRDKDPAFVAKVTEGFQAMYGGQ